MKIIRMTKTMAGPSGTFAPGMLRTVDDDTAAMLIGAEAAELAPGVKQPTLAPEPDADPELVEEETAAVEPAPETAVIEAPRKKVKK